MGSDKTKDDQAFDDEQPQHEVTLPAYRISKYPVTNAQFQAFVDDGGYSEARYWPEAIAAESWREGEIKLAWPIIKENKVEGWDYEWAPAAPRDFGEPYTLPNHPRVGVNWFEALAFCHWLSEQTGQAIRLPTEAEWEKAARGPFPPSGPRPELVEGPVEGEDQGGATARIYPWGNDPDPNKANYSDTGIGTTSAVGCFPNGASPYGVEELSGNVCEWTMSLWGRDSGKPDFNYPYDPTNGRENLGAEAEVLRVLRGGAFLDSQDFVRCALRRGFNPHGRDWTFGFRLVVSPISHPPSAL